MALNPDTRLPEIVETPAYDPEAHGTGIVHFGVGAFHRAHQAEFTDTALAKAGGNWRILGVSLQSTGTADALNTQGGRYTLVTRSVATGGPSFRVIGSIAGMAAATRGTDLVLDALKDPDTRIVSMTVTEKAYGIDRALGAIDPEHPAVREDLLTPDDPKGLIGLIVAGLGARKANGTAPFTILCCDNLPDNGQLVRSAVLGFAQLTDPGLAEWIADNVTFPSTMVDRITPAATPELLEETAHALGAEDLAAIETEPFTQWVIEDKFCNGRPAWEQAGALFVRDVAPFEEMKLRMLNGAHSMLAYLGVLRDLTYVRDVMADPDMHRLVRRHMKAAAATLTPVGGFNFESYADDLVTRFENPNIAHKTVQIAMDGSQKMPQRIFAPAVAALADGHDAEAFALATAAWMRFCSAKSPDGRTIELNDPRAAELSAAARSASGDATAVFDRFAALPGLMPEELSKSAQWRALVVADLSALFHNDLRLHIHNRAASSN